MKVKRLRDLTSRFFSPFLPPPPLPIPLMEFRLVRSANPGSEEVDVTATQAGPLQATGEVFLSSPSVSPFPLSLLVGIVTVDEKARREVIRR